MIVCFQTAHTQHTHTHKMSDTKGILEALSALLTREKLGEWRKQREMLRFNLQQLWGAYGATFCTIWDADEATFPREARLAALLAAKEDVDAGGEVLSMMAEQLLPEFYVAAGGLLEDVPADEMEEKEKKETEAEPKAEAETESKEKVAVDFAKMMREATEKRDVESPVFSFAELEEQLNEIERREEADEEKKGVALEGMKVVRSCLLLQFLSSLMIVVIAQCKEYADQPDPEV